VLHECLPEGNSRLWVLLPGAKLRKAAVYIIIINEYPEAGLTASISVQNIYYRHELQQKLY